VAAVLDVATGYQVAFGELELHAGDAVARDVTVRRSGEPLLSIRRLEVAFSLRDVFPGGLRRYGLSRVDAEEPRLTLIRHADGSFNLPAPAAPPPGPPGPPPAAPPTPGEPPWALDVRVERGSVVVLDPYRALAVSRRLSANDVAASLQLRGTARLRYAARGNFADDPLQRFALEGRIDDGYAVHRLRARSVAIVPVVDYFVNSPGAAFERGLVRDLDVRAYAFGAPADAVPAYHLAGAGTLEDGAMRIPGLLAGARRMRGRIDVFDGGVAAPRLQATLGGLDVQVAGGIYDWSAPAFRLGARIPAAPLRSVRGLFRFSRALPVEGMARLQTLLEGPVASPLVATRFTAPSLRYAAFPVTSAQGRAIYYAASLTIVGARGNYGGLGTAVEGAIALGAPTYTALVVALGGPASRVPYLAQLAPASHVAVLGLLAGAGLSLDARGVATGTGGGTDLAGSFHVDPLGEGTFGPVTVRQAGGSLAASYFSDRSRSSSGFWVDSAGIDFAELREPPHLPGLTFGPPLFAGRLDGSLAGVGPPSAFRIAGHVHARDLRVGSVGIDDVAGDVAGAFGGLRLGRVAARGPWGTFAGGGTYAGGRLALQGDYRGTFAELATLTGNLGAAGSVRGPVVLLIDPRRTLVQARDDVTAGANVHGVPLDRLDGTLAVAGPQLRIYAATAALAGGNFAAAGTLARGGRLGVSVAGVRAESISSLASLGHGGAFAAIGTVRYAAKTPRFDGGVALGGELRAGGLPLAASGDVSLAGSRITVARGDTLLGSALGSLEGDVSGLGTAQARYALSVHLAAARVAPFARLLAPSQRALAGTATGDMRITGTAALPALEGTLALPEGTLNGLAFRAASAYLNVDRTGLKARRGRVTVGSTRVGFGALVRGDDTAIRLDAPRADLSDFNDYFDGGDTLGGRGRVVGRFRSRAGTVRTNADIAIAGLRYRRFDLGDAEAKWNSRGRKVNGAVAFGGNSGRLKLKGTLVVPSRAPLGQMLERSSFDGSADLRGLDLGVWLPALGYQVPVGGRVDAEATIAGPLRAPDVRTTATLVAGSLGRFPIDRFVIAATSTLSRTTVTRAELDLPALTVTAAGSFGAGELDRLALAVHAKSADVGLLANRLGGTTLPLSGTGEVDLKVAGTRARPHVAGGFDIEQAALAGVAIPRVLGEFSARGRDVVLSDVEVGFTTGTLYFAGSLPLQLSPVAIGPSRAPVSLELAAKGIDLRDFAPLLPVGSLLQGNIDGRVAVDGTAGDPRLRGTLALTGAALRTTSETVPLTNVGATLSFAGNGARLERFHAEAGGGTLDGGGSATLASLVRPGADATYRFDLRADKLRLALPAYGSGQVDGTLTLAHAPQSRPLVRGALTLQDATIPFSALLLASGGALPTLGAQAAAPAAPEAAAVAFDLDVSADRNVRVRSSNVDIGGRGSLHVGGIFGAPTLAGGFTSTGGTLAYFNTVFRVVDGTVAFDPSLGLIPTLDARAVTHVINPDPNAVRNVAGSADVTLDVSGPVTNLTIALSSNPAYEREQILGLLLGAPALGASNLFGETNQSATLYGSNATNNLAPGVVGVRNTNGQFSVAQEAFGIANAQFTRTLLAPIETTFASAVGLSSFNVNVDYTGSVGLSARKVLGNKLNALYGTTFGYPYRQTFGFEYKPNAVTAAQLTAFQTLGANGLDSLTPTSLITATNQRLQAAQPTGGSAGVSLSLQRLFP
jgi:hypothetical protein